MKEEFLHFIWKNRLFEPDTPYTTDGEKVEIISTGRHNHHSGPDFLDARIRIGQTLWAGNVEIHLRASDWNRHGHQSDPAYRNTVLHVVAFYDVRVATDHAVEIPAVVIGWPRWIEKNYQELMHRQGWVRCITGLNSIDPFRIRFFLNGLAVERLQKKMARLVTLQDQGRDDWSGTLYSLLSRGMGFSENGESFAMLAGVLPFAILRRHQDSLFQLEALLFGQAGLLQERLFGEEYEVSLLQEYRHLAAKYGLKPMPGHLWKFMRMHPLNFPTLRIAQLAALLHHCQSLFSSMIYAPDIESLLVLLRAEPSRFWDNHYTFGRHSAVCRKRMGEESCFLLIINVLVPFLFFYGHETGRQALKDKAIGIMEELLPETNSIMRHWARAGITPVNALESQALIHLHQEYCIQGRCLHCSIGQLLVLHTTG